MKVKSILVCLLFIITANLHAQPYAVTSLINEYKKQGVTKVDIQKGKSLWIKKFKPDNSNLEKSCTSCHGSNLQQKGKHIKTGKVIKIMAPSANPDSLTKVKSIKKWLKRNCKWTIGRECTAQEKANLLAYIASQ